MSATTVNVEMASVVGTSDGRIFMAGVTDGNMYELHYQEKEVWYGKRYHLINHSARRLLSYIPLLRTSENEGKTRTISLSCAMLMCLQEGSSTWHLTRSGIVCTLSARTIGSLYGRQNLTKVFAKLIPFRTSKYSVSQNQVFNRSHSRRIESSSTSPHHRWLRSTSIWQLQF